MEVTAREYNPLSDQSMRLSFPAVCQRGAMGLSAGLRMPSMIQATGNLRSSGTTVRISGIASCRLLARSGGSLSASASVLLQRPLWRMSQFDILASISIEIAKQKEQSAALPWHYTKVQHGNLLIVFIIARRLSPGLHSHYILKGPAGFDAEEVMMDSVECIREGWLLNIE